MAEITQNWTLAQFKSFVSWCWLENAQSCNPAAAKKFMKTGYFKSAKYG